MASIASLLIAIFGVVQGLCVMSNIMSLIEVISWLFGAVELVNNSPDMLNFMQAFCYVSGFALLLYSIHTSWTRGSDLCEFINQYGVPLYREVGANASFLYKAQVISYKMNEHEDIISSSVKQEHYLM